ncbi:hypothetical protein E3E36_06475 [Thermococcus sp. M36]|uniref:hypothetical protein n=1 Tax=Thermococcus sp. M36 TaxID=1638261 RepID=UPI00143870E5|nr:hypothetical protein [Thermococcus sp. M36]NJE05794.1 hypothetical protein [Thermococcus sp. M36]
MKTVFFFVALILGALLVVGSSGNFNSYNSTRRATVEVVPHDKEYIGFVCDEGYAAVVVVEINSEMDFDALTIMNYLPENKDVDVALYPDYSGLPAGLDVLVETEGGVPVTLAPNEEYTFWGYVNAGDVDPGEYIIPVDIYATWEGGGASISACPIKLIVVSGPQIQKILLSGNTSDIPMETYQEWVFQIVVTNPTGEALELTIIDTIPAEFNVSLAGTSASAGTYMFWPANMGGSHNCGGHQSQPATKMEWNVTVPAGGSEHMNVTIFTRTNGGNHQEFTSCGPYILNEGAEIKGYGIISNSLWVSVACNECCDNCCDGSCHNQCDGDGG